MIFDFFSTLLATAAPAGAGAPSSAQVTSVWDFVIKGGVMMIPIGLCSLVMIAVIAERAVSLRRSVVIPPRFVAEFQNRLHEVPGGPAKALAYASGENNPIARVFTAALKRFTLPLETLERHIAEAGEREVIKLRKNMRALSIIAAVSPLLGLLGTIFGMIAAFQTVAVTGDALGRMELLAGGIYEALITTAAGLIVAIPALIAHHWLSAKIDRAVSEMDQMTLEFVESFALPRAAGAPRPRPAVTGNGATEPTVVIADAAKERAS